ncbi:hypothetical protein Tco_1234883 [Tanacetum coccineum]
MITFNSDYVIRDWIPGDEWLLLWKRCCVGWEVKTMAVDDDDGSGDEVAEMVWRRVWWSAVAMGMTAAIVVL